MRRGSPSSPAISYARSDGSTSAIRTTVLQLRTLEDVGGEVVAFAQLRDPTQRNDAEAALDTLDELQRRIARIPELGEHLERHEAHRLVKGAGALVVRVLLRCRERLHLEVLDAVHRTPRLGSPHERAADPGAMGVPADAHDVDLCRPGRVELQAEEARLAEGERRQVHRLADVGLRRLFDPEPLRKIAQDALRDARPLGAVLDLDDGHGKPVISTPACPR